MLKQTYDLNHQLSQKLIAKAKAELEIEYAWLAINLCTTEQF